MQPSSRDYGLLLLGSAAQPERPNTAGSKRAKPRASGERCGGGGSRPRSGSGDGAASGAAVAGAGQQAAVVVDELLFLVTATHPSSGAASSPETNKKTETY